MFELFKYWLKNLLSAKKIKIEEVEHRQNFIDKILVSSFNNINKLQAITSKWDLNS